MTPPRSAPASLTDAALPPPRATSRPAPPAVAAARLAWVGAVVFLANAGLLVLQLAAGRLLAPFVGSSLETWTSVIGAFLAGIALGNAVGGRAADRRPSGRKLALFLALGALAAVWMLALPRALDATGVHQAVRLGFRIPVLAAVLCLPAGFVLSLLTPMAIRLGLPDLHHAGRVAGVVFALSTLGCLVGNYVTGFYLIPALTVDAIVGATAGMLGLTALSALVGFRSAGERMASGSSPAPGLDAGPRNGASPSPRPHVTLRRGYVMVFLASFAGMTLELAAGRLLAQILGVSLFTWTGVIGVMLAGTALGNALGGILADRRPDEPDVRGPRLATCLLLASVASIGVLPLFFTGAGSEWFGGIGLFGRVLGWTFALFFPAMLLLGTVSPQVIRLVVPDVSHAGTVAGRVYAWSTVGAIAGTFATGYVLVSTLGVYRTILLSAVLPAAAVLLVDRIRDHRPLLLCLSGVLGCVPGGFLLLGPQNTGITRETNYFTIRVISVPGAPGVKTLTLDILDHSRVNTNNPTYLYYPHEQIQMEILRSLSSANPGEQRVLVVGGGGYTFPRAARNLVPTSKVDVVEIDPGVTAVAYEHLGLDPAWRISTYHMDGRQFVAERAANAHYHLVTLDAVNDLTVPAHLLTREFNESVKRALTGDGVYLLTVIDMLEDGQLWRAAVRTLRETFPHVEVLTANPVYKPLDQQLYVIYASNVPLDLEVLRAEAARQGVEAPFTERLPPGEADRLTRRGKTVTLTDQFAPVDNMMAEVFRRRKVK